MKKAVLALFFLTLCTTYTIYSDDEEKTGFYTHDGKLKREFRNGNTVKKPTRLLLLAGGTTACTIVATSLTTVAAYLTAQPHE